RSRVRFYVNRPARARPNKTPRNPAEKAGSGRANGYQTGREAWACLDASSAPAVPDPELEMPRRRRGTEHPLGTARAPLGAPPEPLGIIAAGPSARGDGPMGVRAEASSRRAPGTGTQEDRPGAAGPGSRSRD